MRAFPAEWQASERLTGELRRRAEGLTVRVPARAESWHGGCQIFQAGFCTTEPSSARLTTITANFDEAMMMPASWAVIAKWRERLRVLRNGLKR